MESCEDQQLSLKLSPCFYTLENCTFFKSRIDPVRGMWMYTLRRPEAGRTAGHWET